MLIYRSTVGVFLNLISNAGLILGLAYSSFIFLFGQWLPLWVLVSLVVLSFLALLWTSVYQLHYPSFYESEGRVYYQNGLFNRCLGEDDDIQVRSYLGNWLLKVKGKQSSVIVWGRDYKLAITH